MLTDTDTIELAVIDINQAPTAVNDDYSVNTTLTLTVTVAEQRALKTTPTPMRTRSRPPS